MSRLTNDGWDLVITLNGSIISSSYIVNTLTVEATEDTSTLCDFVLRLPSGTINLDSYKGLPVTVDVVTASGMYRIFTGVVDIPLVDLTLETITFKCTNKVEELLNTSTAAFNSAGDLLNSSGFIGFYSSIIFSTPKDQAEQIKQLMETIPASFHCDPYNALYVIDWEPNATPDFIFTDSDILYGSPQVELTSRGRVLNQIEVKFQYRYERAYHTEYDFQWTSPIVSDICTMLVDGTPMCQRNLIEAAVASAGWPVRGDISYTAIPVAGWYMCGWVQVGFSPVTINGSTSTVKDANGNVVKDANGQSVTQTTITSIIDYRPVFCLGANWEGTTRWLQTLTEEYTCTFTAPQSIAQYGLIDTQQSFGVTDRQTAAGWENYSVYNDTGHGNTYYIDSMGDRTIFNTAFVCAANRAKTSILKTHRENYIKFHTLIHPEIDLRHTVQVSATKVSGTGKIHKYKHFFDMDGTNYTEFELAFYLSEGSQSDDALSIPTLPDTSVVVPTGVVVLGNHYGENPANDINSGKWTGFIANKYVGGVLTKYPTSFKVVTPAISDDLRKSITKSAAQTYNIQIPNNPLTVTFNGKL